MKFEVNVALVLLLEQYPHPWFTVPVAIIIGREIVISALREWMGEFVDVVREKIGGECNALVARVKGIA